MTAVSEEMFCSDPCAVSMVVSSPVGPLWQAERRRPANNAAIIAAPPGLVSLRSPMTAFIAFSSLDAGLEMPDTWSPHRVPQAR